MYELDAQSAAAFQQLHDALAALARSGAIWHIGAIGAVYDPKYHAGSQELLDRKRIVVRENAPPFVRTNVSISCVPLGNGALYFFPDGILVYKSSGVGAVGYEHVKLSCASDRFVEHGSVPKDAEIVGHTWPYVDKAGGPDHRFRANCELPICEYEQISFQSNSGMNELLQVSRVGVGAEIDKAIQNMALSLAGARRAQANRQATRLEEPQGGDAPSPPPVSLPRPSARPRVSEPSTAGPQQNGDIYEALFRILCCVMVALRTMCPLKFHFRT